MRDNFLICGESQVGKTYIANLMRRYFKYIILNLDEDGVYPELKGNFSNAAYFGKIIFDGLDDSFRFELDTHEYKTIYVYKEGTSVNLETQRKYDACIENKRNDKSILEQLIKEFKEEITVYPWSFLN